MVGMGIRLGIRLGIRGDIRAGIKLSDRLVSRVGGIAVLCVKFKLYPFFFFGSLYHFGSSA